MPVFDRVVSYAVIVNYSQPVIRLLLSAALLLAGRGLMSIVWVNSAMFLYAFAALTVKSGREPIHSSPLPIRILVKQTYRVLSKSL